MGGRGDNAKAENSANGGCATLRKLNFPCCPALLESIPLCPHAYGKRRSCFPRSPKALCSKDLWLLLCGKEMKAPAVTGVLAPRGRTGGCLCVSIALRSWPPLSRQPRGLPRVKVARRWSQGTRCPREAFSRPPRPQRSARLTQPGGGQGCFCATAARSGW